MPYVPSMHNEYRMAAKRLDIIDAGPVREETGCKRGHYGHLYCYCGTCKVPGQCDFGDCGRPAVAKRKGRPLCIGCINTIPDAF